MSRIRIAIWIACGALLMALAFATLFAVNVGPSPDGGGPSIVIGGPFNLVDHNGRAVTDRDFKGRPLVVFFGFTFCPDVCPTTLSDLTAMMSEIGPAANAIQVLFISVDHERDAPEQLRQYMTAFDSRFLALTGGADELTRVTQAFRVYFKKIDMGGNATYTMDHTATVFLMDSRQRFTGTIDLHEDRKIGLAKLKRLVAG